MTDFETEGDVREYVEENTEEAVLVSVDEHGDVWFHVDNEGDFAVTLDPLPPEANPHAGPILGDDYEFPPTYTVQGTRDADEVPERGTHPLEEMLDQLTDTPEGDVGIGL